jgi:hypothetical protein
VLLCNDDLSGSDTTRAIDDVRSGRAFNLISLRRMWGISAQQAGRVWKQAKAKS